MKRHLTLSLIILVIGASVFAQYGNLPLSNDFSRFIIRGDAEAQYNFHTSLKPYEAQDFDSLKWRLKDLDIVTESKVVGLLLNADTGRPQERLLQLSLAPIIHATYGQGTSNDSTDYASNLGIGINLRGFVGKKLDFGFEYTYSISQYADYVEERIREKGVIPGMGKADFRGDRIRNKYYSGYVSYTPVDFLNIQAGIGKHFIGNGYRSLILSDNSFVYPYLRLNIKIWKLKYQVLYSNFKNVTYYDPNVLITDNQKYSTSGLLSMNIGKNFNFGLYQSVIWYNDPESYRGFDVNYMNPVVFLRPVEFSIGSPDNVIMGLDLRYTFFKKYSIYGQVVIDEFLLNEIKANEGWWGNKYGYQIGFKANDLFNLQGLSLLVEHNWVKPYTYSHGNVYQNYGNYNEALAHTLGANFSEFIGQVSYVKKRWMFSTQSMYADKGEDFSQQTSFGGDIFLSNTLRESDYGNVTGQGFSTKRQYHQIKVAYLINPDWRLMFEIGYTYRKISYTDEASAFELNEYSNMFHIGFKTALYNQYLDF